MRAEEKKKIMFFQEEMPVEFNKNVAGSGSDVEKNLCFELNFLSCSRSCFAAFEQI